MMCIIGSLFGACHFPVPHSSTLSVSPELGRQMCLVTPHSQLTFGPIHGAGPGSAPYRLQGAVEAMRSRPGC